MSSTTKFEVLPDELLIIILKKLRLHDRYYSFARLNCRFDSLLKYLTPQEICKTDIEDDIEWFREDLTRGRYFTFPYSDKTSDRFGWVMVPVAQSSSENIPDSVTRICKKYAFDLEKSFFFLSSDEERLQRAQEQAARCQMNGDSHGWEIHMETTHSLEIKKVKSEEQDAMIIETAQKIWAELFEENLLRFCVDI
ncbi:hypothetical protein I4U23_010855 [Adineta vaga]|nr:hypothetical protein I4U23_010855 [Adineta vaga]